MFGLPSGVHRIIDRRLAIRLGLIVLGSIVVSLGDMVGVAAVLPLIEVIMGGTYSPLLQRISSILGDPPPTDLAIRLAVVMATAFIVKSSFGIAFRWWMGGVMADAEIRAATAIYAKFMAAPYWLHRSRPVPEILRAIYEGSRFAYGYVGLVLSIVIESITIVAMAVTLLLIMPGATVGAVIYFGLTTFLVYRLSKRRVEDLAKKSLEVGLRLNTTVMSSVYGFREARLHGLTGPSVRTFERDKTTGTYYGRVMGFFMELPKYVLDLVFFFGVAILVAIVFSTNTPQKGLGMLAVFVAAASRILPSLVRITASFSGLRSSRPGVQVFLYEHALLDKWDRESLEPSDSVFPKGDIEFRNVHYAYPSTWLPVLNGVDVTIRRGQSVAIVGMSGSGKTTMVDILLGLLTPQTGEVIVGGRPIAENLVAWRNHVGVVPQDVYLFDDTLRENVVMNAGGPTDEGRLAEVLAKALLNDVVADLPKGVDSTLGERGTRLSGGQRQRIGIARALYRRPDLLVLDEATSALDNETEFRVTETIRDLHGQVTIIVVAHRLSTIKHCDVVLFMKDGRIEARGTFAEVERDNADFARLVELGNVRDPAE